MNTRLSQGRWLNLGAIAVLALSILYVFFWPGPEGLSLTKLGLPQRTITLEAVISGINSADIAATLRPGESVQASINNAPELPLMVQSIESLPSTVVATQPQGTVKPQPDPRPEMGFGNNLLIKLEGRGYANPRGVFLGLKRARVATTLRIKARGFEAPASIVDVVVS
ncbi:MAG: DUF4330 domain-containing protein [Thermosynechococcaceae cyanobacterium]